MHDCCCCFLTPFERRGHGGRPCSPRSLAVLQSLDQRSLREEESPKSERRKESVAMQCRMRGVLGRMTAGATCVIFDLANSREI